MCRSGFQTFQKGTSPVEFRNNGKWTGKVEEKELYYELFISVFFVKCPLEARKIRQYDLMLNVDINLFQ